MTGFEAILASKLLVAIGPIIAPFLTAALKKLWAMRFQNAPLLNWIKSYVAGTLLAMAAKETGVPIPTDLTTLDIGTVQSILASGVVIAALGSWIRDFFDILKRQFPDNTTFGKALRTLAGRATLGIVILIQGGPMFRSRIHRCITAVMAGLIVVGLAMGMAPAPAAAAQFTTQFETLDSTLLTGWTLPKGFHDPGESIGFNFPTPQWTVHWNGQRVLNLGSLDVALTGSAGADGAAGDNAALGAGPGGCLFDGVCAAYLYVVDSRAPNNFMPWVTVDVIKTGGRLIGLLGAAWSTTKAVAATAVP